MNKRSAVPEPRIEFEPRTYRCKRAVGQSEWNGRLDQPFWQQAAWTEDFVDIEGTSKPLPDRQTRVKMMWDEHYFYIGAELEETEIWANQHERDSVIFQDNDFEIFIDPDGDSHQYYEFEINALNTVWDLLLVKPYRDDGPPVNGWDINGLKTAVYIDGQLNHPAADNRMWSVEIGLPWSSLQECAADKRPPLPGEYWRVNFSRVQWQVDIIDGQYVKRTDPVTGRALPEDNWVWSPQGVINMHYPEMWGYVLFEEESAVLQNIHSVDHDHAEGDPIAEDDVISKTEAEQLKWTLRRLYYKQRLYAEQHGRYCTDVQQLITVGDPSFSVTLPESLVMETTSSMFQMSAYLSSGADRWCIRDDGLIWKE